MDDLRSSFAQLLFARRATIGEQWYQAIAHTTFSPLSTTNVRQHLATLTDQAIALLIADQFDEQQARDIGAMLVRLRYLQPEVLQQTIAVLSANLGTVLMTDQEHMCSSRIMALLGAIATGFAEQARVLILNEQEAARAALLSERNRVLEALVETEERLRAIFTGAGIGITLVDLEGRPVTCNPAFLRMLGYCWEEMRGLVFTDITHADDIAVDKALFEELVAGKRGHYQKEKRYRHKDGHVVWCNLTTSLVRDAHGAPQLVIGMVEDITVRKHIESELMDAERRLVESREMERLHLARDLHDSALQQLLDINLHLGETRQRAGDQQSVEVPVSMVEIVQQKVQGIIAQLRDLLRDLRPPGLEEYGLMAALDGAVAQLNRERWDTPPIALDIEGQDTALPTAVSLPLYHAAQEALRNALTHAQAQRITLSLRVHPTEAVMTVRDDGIGFLVPDQLSTLAHRRHFGLIGIAERVTLAGGNLTIHSQCGGGTEVAVRIPISREGEDDDRNDSCDHRG